MKEPWGDYGILELTGKKITTQEWHGKNHRDLPCYIHRDAIFESTGFPTLDL